MRYMLPLLLMSLLTGCASPTSISGKTETIVCEVWRPVSWSAKDTDQTIREIKLNNAAHDAYCAP